MTDDKQTGKVDVDGSEMKLFEEPVNLPDKVVVVDAKLGKEIGFVDKAQVMHLLETDPRYSGFEDGCTGQFMLSYDPEGVRKNCIQLETSDLVEFIEVIENNVKTAEAADDVKNLRLGVAYEYHGRNYVLYLSFVPVKKYVKYMDADIRAAILGDGSEASNMESPTARLIELFRERAGSATA